MDNDDAARNGDLGSPVILLDKQFASDLKEAGAVN